MFKTKTQVPPLPLFDLRSESGRMTQSWSDDGSGTRFAARIGCD